MPHFRTALPSSTLPPHTHMFHQRKSRPQPKKSFRNRNECRKEPSPIRDMAGDRENTETKMQIPIRCSNITSASTNSRTYCCCTSRLGCCKWWVLGLVGRWVGCCTCCCCYKCSTAVHPKCLTLHAGSVQNTRARGGF